MSALNVALRRSSFVCSSCRVRTFAKQAAAKESSTPDPSSCAANTVLTGLNYLKNQEPVLALPDEDYPPWLWQLLKRTVLPDDGPGGKAEKQRLRKLNRQKIREQNLTRKQ